MSKLGASVSHTDRTGIGTVLAAGAPFVSMIDQNLIAEAHQYGAFAAYRTQRGLMGADNPPNFMDVLLTSQRALGRAFLDSQLPIWQANPGADAYVINNEQDIGTLDHGAKLNEFFLGAMERANELGIKIVIGNFSSGNPNDNDGITLEQRWATMLPAIAYACDHGHCVGLHVHGFGSGLIASGESLAYRHDRSLRFFASHDLYPKVLITELSNATEGIQPDIDMWWSNVVAWDQHVMASPWNGQIIGAALYGWTPDASLTPAVARWAAWVAANPDPPGGIYEHGAMVNVTIRLRVQ